MASDRKSDANELDVIPSSYSSPAFASGVLRFHVESFDLIMFYAVRGFGAGACRRRSSAADPGRANVIVVGGAGDRFFCVLDGILRQNVGFDGIGGNREG